MHPPVFIMRHGQTTWNVEGRMQGRLDSDLTAMGQVQAARQGAILRNVAVGLPAFVSPLGRARKTAGLAGQRAAVDDRLAEIGMGAWEGRLRSDLIDAPGITWKFNAPGGEAEADLLSRIDGLLAALPGPAILITHGVLSIVLRARLMGLGVQHWDDMDDPQGVVHYVANGTETIYR